MNDQAVGIPWYQRLNYQRLKATIFDDGDQLPPTYDEWLEDTQEIEEGFEQQGVVTVRAYIEPAIFKRYCAIHGLKCDGEARRAFAKLAVLQSLDVA
jgi:hypothetical protein